MSSNPYEVTPRIWNEWHELLKEKLRCEATKTLALEIGRLGLVLGFCMTFAACMGLLEKSSGVHTALTRLLWAVGFVAAGLAVSYPLYKPVRARLNEIELLLPTATENEDAAESEDDEESSEDDVVEDQDVRNEDA